MQTSSASWCVYLGDALGTCECAGYSPGNDGEVRSTTMAPSCRRTLTQMRSAWCFMSMTPQAWLERKTRGTKNSQVFASSGLIAKSSWTHHRTLNGQLVSRDAIGWSVPPPIPSPIGPRSNGISRIRLTHRCRGPDSGKSGGGFDVTMKPTLVASARATTAQAAMAVQWWRLRWSGWWRRDGHGKLE